MRGDTIEAVVAKGRFVQKGTPLPLSYAEFHRTVEIVLPGKQRREDILEHVSDVCFNYENDPILNCFAIEWEYERRWSMRFYCLPWCYCTTKVVVTYESWPRKKS